MYRWLLFLVPGSLVCSAAVPLGDSARGAPTEANYPDRAPLGRPTGRPASDPVHTRPRPPPVRSGRRVWHLRPPSYLTHSKTL